MALPAHQKCHAKWTFPNLLLYCEEQCEVGHYTWTFLVPLDETVFKEYDQVSNLIPNNCFL
jgi:hypothetical protein